MMRSLYLIFILILILLFSFFSLFGCIKSASEICITNMDEVYDDNLQLTGKPPTINTDSGYSAPSTCNPNSDEEDCSECNGQWYDCSEYLSTGYCKICSLMNVDTQVQEYYSPPLLVAACPDTSLLNEKCEFGCSYFVCTQYFPKKVESRSISPADAAQSERKFGSSASPLLSLGTGKQDLLFSQSLNFLHSTCEFKKLTKKSFDHLKKNNALFITYRLGAGRNFEDFELANSLVPLSAASTGLNPNGGVDRYQLYFTEQMKNPNNVPCHKNSEGFWELSGYTPSAADNERINKFTTFSECMLNAHPDYLGNSNANDRRPFVPQSFCYSQDYLNKHLPYLDQSTGRPFSKKRYMLYLAVNYSNSEGSSDHTLSYDIKEIERWFSDVSLDSFGFNPTTSEYYLANRIRDEYLDTSTNNYALAPSDPLMFARIFSASTDVDNTKEDYDKLSPQEKIPGHKIVLFEEGEVQEETYNEMFKKVPQYYEQFKEGSTDRQGRPKLGAEFECEDGFECMSSFCSREKYRRTSCTANESGDLIQVACGCNQVDCNYFYPDDYELYDNTLVSKSSQNKPYLTGKDMENKHAKVYVMKQNYYGRGAERFLYWVNLGSEPYIQDGKIISDLYSGVVLKNDSNGWKSKTLQDVCNEIGSDSLTRYSDVVYGGSYYRKQGTNIEVWNYCDLSVGLDGMNYFFDETYLAAYEDNYKWIALLRSNSNVNNNPGDPFLALIKIYDQGIDVSCNSIESKTLTNIYWRNLHKKEDLTGDLTSEYFCVSPIRSKPYVRASASNTGACCSHWDTLSSYSCDCSVCDYPLQECGEFSSCGGTYNVLEEEPVWAWFEGYVEDQNQDDEVIGVKSLFDDSGNRRFDKNVLGGGPYINATIIGSTALEAQSRTFVESNNNDKEMYLLNYVVSSPEALQDLAEKHDMKDWIFASFHGSPDDPVLSNNINAYIFDIVSNNVPPMTPIGFRDLGDGAPMDYGIQEMKRCAATGKDALVIPMGGEERAVEFSTLSEYLTLGPKAFPDYKKQPNGKPYIHFNILANFVKQGTPSKDDFSVYDACDDGNIEVAFCFNPYFVKYDEYNGMQGSYTGPSVYDVSSILEYYNWTGSGGPGVSQSFRNALMNYFETCKDIPPKYYCLGTWAGDPYTGTCYGDMAVSAYVFKDDVTDGMFGKCIYKDNSFTGLDVHEFGICEANTPFNMAFDEIQANVGEWNFSGYLSTNPTPSGDIWKPLNAMGVMLLDHDDNNPFDNEFYEEVGKIIGASDAVEDSFDISYNTDNGWDISPDEAFPPSYNEWNPFSYIYEGSKKNKRCKTKLLIFKSCHTDYTHYYDVKYLYNEFLWEYVFKNPVTGIGTFSYTLPLEGYLYFYNFYDSQNKDYKGFFNYYEEHLLSNLPKFYGVYTKRPTNSTLDGVVTAPEYSEIHPYPPKYTFYSDDAYNPDNFYPSRHYLVEKIISYLKRGILPVIIADDPDLYINKYTYMYTSNNDDKTQYPFVVSATSPLFVYKILEDVQLATRNPDSKTGFSQYGELPAGSVVVVVNKLLYDPTNFNSFAGFSPEQYSFIFPIFGPRYCKLPEPLTPPYCRNFPLNRARVIKSKCETCLPAIMVDLGQSNIISITSNTNSLTNDDIGVIVNYLVNLFSLDNSKSTNPNDFLYCSNDGRTGTAQNIPSSYNGVPKSCDDEMVKNLDLIIYKIVVDVRGINENNARNYINKFVLLSNRTTLALGKPNIIYIKDLIYNNEEELNLFFSYLNYRKPDLISAGNIGIQFEDVVNKDSNIPTSSSQGDKHFYLISASDPGKVETGLCQLTKNLLPIGGLLTLKSVTPLTATKNCTSYDCINSSSQCLSAPAGRTATIFCKVKKGDGAPVEFYITDYNEEMADFLGLSLTQTGFTLCDNPAENSTVFKTLAVPAQYVVPITYSNVQSKACYPTSVTPQELQEIFTSGIKFATCYPVYT